jgi:hypothetical protein
MRTIAQVGLESAGQTWQTMEPRNCASMKTIFSLCLVLAVGIGFSGCEMFKKKKPKKDAATVEAEERMQKESSQVDFQGFVGRLRKAVRARDMNTIASMMTPDFGYKLGATPAEDLKGEGVFQYWDENSLWQELDGILSEKFVPKGEYMVAPPQFADENLHYDGYRAGIRRIGGSWKFVYFVNG